MPVETERYERFAETAVEGVKSAPQPLPEKHCGAGSSGIAVDPYGNVYPCVQWRRAVANLHDVRIAEMWQSGFDGIRRETVEAAGVVAAHPHGRLLNFCPGLAEVLTGSATRVPKEMERVAEIVAAENWWGGFQPPPPLKELKS
jgi:hypothetical protein